MMESEDEPSSLQSLRIGGTEIHYQVLCPRKLWWYSHGLEQEHAGGASGTSAGQENVALGTLLHEDGYPGAARRDVLIDGLIRLDFTEPGTGTGDGGTAPVVHEIKKSRGALKATRLQILYYLYYLKHEKGIETTGVIDFPKERRRETVTLTPGAETEVEQAIAGVQRTREMPTPPPVEEPMPICRKCAYQDLCWG